MRSILIGLVVSLALASPTRAQDLIVSRQHEIDTIPQRPIALDGNEVAVWRDTFERQAERWVPSGTLIGTTSSLAADDGRFLTGHADRTQAGTPLVGIVRIQERTSGAWTLDGTLVPSDVRQGMRFGTFVDLSGDTAVVFAEGWRPAGQPASARVGAVFVHRKVGSSWPEEALLTPGSGERFDGEIAIDGDTLVVGGNAPSASGGSPPAVHVFERGPGGWSRVAVLHVPQFVLGGMRLAVQEGPAGSSTTIAIGGLVLDAWVFTGQGASWTAQTLTTTQSADVALSGALLAVGEPRAIFPGVDRVGAVGLYGRDGSGAWILREKIHGGADQIDHGFGESVDLDGEWLAVGPGTFDGSLDTSVDLLRVVPVGATEYCPGLPNSTGAVARIGSSGSTGIAANDLELVAGPLPSQRGLFFVGAARVQVPFGAGFRCVGAGAGGLYRLPPARVHGELLSQSLDLAAAQGPGAAIVAGSTWRFQAWYPDPAAGAGVFNLSTALELSFGP